MTQIATSLVGSYPQPAWLIDRDRLRERLPPRVRAAELWQIDPRYLREAQDDAVRLVVADQLAAGLDVITDGEVRRESYSNAFANALDGIDLDHPGETRTRAGGTAPVPRIVGPLARRHPIHAADVAFLRTLTDRPIKVTIPGPFTMSQQAQDEHYGSEEALALAYAQVVREEIADLFAAGADVVQLDEPWLESRAENARRFAIPTLQRTLDGAAGTTAIHLCFGYPAFVPDHPRRYDFLGELAAVPVDQISIESAQAALELDVLEQLPGKTIILGVIALDTEEVESSGEVARRLRRGLDHVGPERLIAAPDCGMKYLSRASALGKLQALVAGAAAAQPS